MTIITTPLARKVTIHKDGRIEGDYDDLAGWVRSGSHRDQDAYVMWFLFLKEWERQRLREEILARPDLTWNDMIHILAKKHEIMDR